MHEHDDAYLDRAATEPVLGEITTAQEARAQIEAAAGKLAALAQRFIDGPRNGDAGAALLDEMDLRLSEIENAWCAEESLPADSQIGSEA